MPTRILMIEDNPANMELMTYLLKAFGYELLSAADGESGLTIASKEQPDLIICDVHLPQLDGYGVVRVLKRHPALKGIPAIAVTALAMAGDREKLLEAGFDGYISKPIEPETFIAELARFLPAGGKDTADMLPVTEDPTLLVICDEVDNRARIARQIGSYRAIWTDSLKQGLDLLRMYPFDLALIDLQLPMESCVREIEEGKTDPAFTSLPLIIFGPRPPHDLVSSQGSNSGVARFLQRTVEPGVLADEIETCLHQSNRRKDGDHTNR